MAANHRGTLFPTAEDFQHVSRRTHSESRKFANGTKPLDLALKPATPSNATYLEPKRRNPEESGYKCIMMMKIDPREQKYCLAQTTQLDVVMIRRWPMDRNRLCLVRPNRRILNFIEAFEYNNSLWVVYDRPGKFLPCVLKYTTIGTGDILTISREVKRNDLILAPVADAG
ncbi:hypothetical protein BU24DRAFT_415970 [Aaosphaeria arxii CBS 175.79]|uniref:Uncharacterized protein n=1 Tax=Aaosphaeria arxii CBS 175.79 TaxID=1450172 RepID=A0A6A5X5R6_9PLEO|nr:uncharacterized protein BU24DRAFT_415970 [Aaosphaeria arxii CBS 175.79]KAF2008335.1 hypothetical protein BU24DRAFT_415970 [Aaosphaeria arxii CBS 175.79]